MHEGTVARPVNNINDICTKCMDRIQQQVDQCGYMYRLALVWQDNLITIYETHQSPLCPGTGL